MIESHQRRPKVKECSYRLNCYRLEYAGSRQYVDSCDTFQTILQVIHNTLPLLKINVIYMRVLLTILPHLSQYCILNESYRGKGYYAMSWSSYVVNAAVQQLQILLGFHQVLDQTYQIFSK